MGTFEDLGVSASVAPSERPDLGPWLTDPEKIDSWDVIVWAKMDRAFRSTRHCVDFAQWAEEHKKIVVFAEDGLKLDYVNPSKGIDSMLAELFVYLGSFFAQMELARFQQRAKDMHRMLKPTTRWASGVPPLGFRTIDHPSGKGKTLERDPEGYKILWDMAGRLLDGWSFTAIAHDLNERKVPTNQDRAKIARGEEPKVNPWSATHVQESLTHPKTQGWKQNTHGVPVLDDSGNQIRMAEPTFDDDTWEKIQGAVEARRQAPRSRTNSPNPMLGVGFCGQCGKGLAQQYVRRPKADGTPTENRYYRCSKTPRNCTGTFIVADILDELLEEHFLEEYGDVEVTERVFIPGEDHSYELERVNATIARLRREQDAGLIVTEEDEEIYLARMRALVDQRTELQAKGSVSAGWRMEGTGKTFREVWDEEETDRRKILQDRGVRLALTSNKPLIWALEVPGIE